MSTEKEHFSVEKQILKTVSNHKRGKIFFPNSFSKIGSPSAVRQALKRLEAKNELIRLAQGIYLYPKKHKVLGVLHPSIEEIAQAIAKRDKARIIPTGVLALNKLGLSTQIPLNPVYLTDGSPRSIKVKKYTIKFKKASPKILSIKDETTLLIILALKEIGKNSVDNSTVEKIQDIVTTLRSDNLKHDLKLAPVWIRNIINSAFTK